MPRRVRRRPGRELARARRRTAAPRPSAGRPRRPARLHHLHLRLDRAGPKGVAVEHASICNFVRVAAEVYGDSAGRPRVPGHDDRLRLLRRGDLGAVGGRGDARAQAGRVGAARARTCASSCAAAAGHRDVLRADAAGDARRGPAGPAVPAGLRRGLPARPDRALAPRRAAVPQRLRADRGHGHRDLDRRSTRTAPVTIGVPLPDLLGRRSSTRSDPRRALPLGEIGEIGIAGHRARRRLRQPRRPHREGVRPGLLGLPEQPVAAASTAPATWAGSTATGEIEYHGRIDPQVKIRGYRIELTEIESVLLQVPGIAQAVVDTYEPVPGTVELVAYYSRAPTDARVRGPRRGGSTRCCATGCRRTWCPRTSSSLDVIPMTPSDKADRKTPAAAVGPAPRRVGAASHTAAAADAGRDGPRRLLGRGCSALERVSADANLLRRPRRQLPAAGPVLRPVRAAARPAAGVDAATCTCTRR